MIEINKLHNIDCIEFMRTMGDNTVDLLLTDIPYDEVNNVREVPGFRKLHKEDADTSTFDLNDFLNQCLRITKGSIYIFCGSEQVSEIIKFFKQNKLSTRSCVWVKSNPSPMRGEYLWLSAIEHCVYAKKPKATFNQKCKKNAWEFPIGRSKVHPTEKNLKLFEYLIESSSNPGDLVFDPCAGYSTTLLAAKNLNRNYLGCELSEKYYKLSLDRLK